MELTTPDKRRLALARYVEELESLTEPAALNSPPFPYDVCPLIKEVAWRTPSLIAEHLVEGELRELTNTLNEWRGALRRWYAWLAVLEGFSDEDAWALQWEFVESIAFQCLFYPSATRDRFTFVATNTLHQVRMAIDATYPDCLASDPKPGKENKLRFLPRKEAEAQLEAIAAGLDGGTEFIAWVLSIDEDDYLGRTSNFRNLASHAIAPRLTIGYTNMVVRHVVPATKMVQQPDGTFQDEPIPGKQQVSYGFGGTDPLQLRAVFEANLVEFEKASACFHAYADTLNKALATLPRN